MKKEKNGDSKDEPKMEDEPLDIWKIPKIDTHVHIGTDAEDEDRFTPTQLYHDMKEYNIKKAIIFPFNTDPEDGFSRANKMIYRLKERYDPLEGLSRIDPNHPEWEKEMEKGKSLGMKGFKFHPKAQEFACDEIGEAYEKAMELDMPILIHSAHKEGVYVEQLEKILPSYSDMTIILAHAGITEQSPAIQMANEMDNVYLELSINKKHRVEALSLTAEEDKMMFGSDSPYGGIETTLERMDVDWRNEKRMQKVFFKNAERVFNI